MYLLSSGKTSLFLSQSLRNNKNLLSNLWVGTWSIVANPDFLIHLSTTKIWKYFDQAFGLVAKQ